MKKIILILLLLFAYSCDDQANKNSDNPNNPSGFTDKIGRVYYAANTPCKAGDYSQYPTGIKDVTIECDHDGKLSRQVSFKSPDFMNYTSPYKSAETLYRANGSTERNTEYENNGNKIDEHLYRADGSQERGIRYGMNGNKRYESLYRADGSQERSTSYYENRNKNRETLYRADGSRRKYQVFDMSGTPTSTTYYQADGEEQCSPSGTRCVSADPL